MKKKRALRNPWFAGLVLFQAFPIVFFLWNLGSQSQQTTDAGWMTSTDGQCKVFTNYNFQNRSFNWTGGCVDGYADGFGELEILEGNRKILLVKGSLTKGMLEGQASLQFLADGDLYEGNFVASAIQGKGHFHNDDGDHYEGEYAKGIRSGHGVYWYPPESPLLKYEGKWQNGQQEGPGTLHHRSGKTERGIFKAGRLEKTIAEVIPNAAPRNILITNDDGIEDMARLQCLAEAFSPFANKILIAVSSQNRSGTSNITQTTRQGYIEVKQLAVDSARQIYTYQVEGYPGDCVLFGAPRFLSGSKGKRLIWWFPVSMEGGI